MKYINRKNGMIQEMKVEDFKKLDTRTQARYRIATDQDMKAASSVKQEVKKPVAAASESNSDEKKA